MDTLFTPEVLQQILAILDGAVGGSVTAVVVYFLLPAIIILITSSAWLTGVYLVVKNIKSMVCSYFDGKKATVEHIEKENVRLHELELSARTQKVDSVIVHQLGTGSEYLRFNKEKLNAVLRLYSELSNSVSNYIHDSDFDFITTALENQFLLHKHFKKTYGVVKLTQDIIKDIKIK